MSFDDLDAVDQAELVRRGEATPSELVDEASRRIDEVNPNAVIHDRSDEAMAESASDALGDGPFRGVPFLVKDALCAIRGEPYHHGVRTLRGAGWRAQSTSCLAESLAHAGLVTIGRTNVPELTTSITTEPLAYGPTRNPWTAFGSIWADPNTAWQDLFTAGTPAPAATTATTWQVVVSA